jgi:hypothetical protein
MKRQTNPIYTADDGSHHATPQAAAAHDAKCYFDRLLFADDSHVIAGELANKWLDVRQRLNALYDELRIAMKAGPYDPLPEDTYYSLEHDNFYSISYHRGKGEDFQHKWYDRRHEFPGDPRLGQFGITGEQGVTI